jgi:hypothetical protein
VTASLQTPKRPPASRRGRFSVPVRSWLSALAVIAGLIGAGQPAPAQSPVAPSGPVPFQPGVWIDWQERSVVVASRVVLRRGILEFLACRPGKEHESILRLEATATHVYMALGLIGLEPGYPPRWNEATGGFSRPAGDLLCITCVWESAGREHAVDAFAWLREIEYVRTPISRPWVFAGSLPRGDGTLSADHSGVGIALVDFSDSLITLSAGYPSDYSAMWVEGNTPAIPPIDTPVKLILRPAAARKLDARIDFRGQTYVDDRWVSLTELADLLKLARQLDPYRPQTIRSDGALGSDVARVRQALERLGVAPPAVRFERTDEASSAGGAR